MGSACRVRPFELSLCVFNAIDSPLCRFSSNCSSFVRIWNWERWSWRRTRRKNNSSKARSRVWKIGFKRSPHHTLCPWVTDVSLCLGLLSVLVFFYLLSGFGAFCLMRRKSTRTRGDEMAVSLRTACINEPVLLNSLQGIGSEREYLIPCALIKITWAEKKSQCLKRRKTVCNYCIRLPCLQGSSHLG